MVSEPTPDQSNPDARPSTHRLAVGLPRVRGRHFKNVRLPLLAIRNAWCLTRVWKLSCICSWSQRGSEAIEDGGQSIAVGEEGIERRVQLDFCHHVASVSVLVSWRFWLGVSFCMTSLNAGVAKIQRRHKSRRTRVMASENVTIVLPVQVGFS